MRRSIIIICFSIENIIKTYFIDFRTKFLVFNTHFIGVWNITTVKPRFSKILITKFRSYQLL
jgi:hypothetical protein